MSRRHNPCNSLYMNNITKTTQNCELNAKEIFDAFNSQF